MNKDTRPAVVEAQAPLVLSDCLRRSKGDGARRASRGRAASALDLRPPAAPAAGVLWCGASARELAVWGRPMPTRLLRAAAGPAQLLRIAAAAALTPIAQEDRYRSKVKLAGELWGLAAWRPGGGADVLL
jgi:hypothetical protein